MKMKKVLISAAILSSVAIMEPTIVNLSMVHAETSQLSARPSTVAAKTYTWGGLNLTLENGVLTIPGDTVLSDSPGSIDMALGSDGSKVTKIVISGSVTLPKNSSTIFSNLYNVVKIEGLNHLDTSNVQNMSMMFKNCTGLKSLDLSNFDTSSATNMAGMFYGDESLTYLDLSNFDTSNVQNMSYLFAGDKSLTSLNLSNIDTSKVTNMNFMFNSVGLTHFDFSNIDTSKVVSMTSMFEFSKFTSLNLSSFDTSNVTIMKNMFYHCYSLANLDLSSFNTSKVTDMDLMLAFAPLIQLKLGAQTNLTTPLNTPSSSISNYNEKWQTLGTGTVHNPNGNWTGTSEELVARSKAGVADTYVAQVKDHDYKFTANNLTIDSKDVEKLNILKQSQATFMDAKFPEDKFTLTVLDRGELSTQAGTYKIKLGVKEVAEETKEITITVKNPSVPDVKNPSVPDVKNPSVPDVKYQTVYRVYNKNTGEHFYTTSAFERESLIKGGWSNEGTGWTAPDQGTAVYRVYNPNAKGGDHYYTASKFEAESLVKSGWKWDNGGKPVLYSGGKTKVYVAFNPNAKASGSHNYTSSSFEQQSLLKNGWTYGKVQFYGK